MSDLDVKRLCETYRAFLALGNDTIDGPECLAIRNDHAPEVYDANMVFVGPEASIDSAFAFLEEQLGARPYRNFLIDPFAPPEFPAELALRDYVPDPTLQMLLVGELEGPPPRNFDIRPVESDADWQALGTLFRADHVETDLKNGTRIFTAALTEQIVATHRRAAADVHFSQVWIGSEAAAFFSSWPGRNGIGMVEDLFTLPAHRHQGIARALIHHCVADARARGAEKVLIGAETDDTPKNLYAGLGFRPCCLTQSWLKRINV